MDPQPGIAFLGEPRPPATGHSGQWGLASLLMGGVVLILVPLFLLVFFTGTQLAWNNPSFDDKAMSLASLGSTAIVGGLAGLAVFGFIFGIIGLVSGLVRGQPGGLALGGTLTCLVAMVLAIILLLATFRLAGELKKRVEGRSRQPNPVAIPGK